MPSPTLEDVIGGVWADAVVPQHRKDGVVADVDVVGSSTKEQVQTIDLISVVPEGHIHESQMEKLANGKANGKASEVGVPNISPKVALV